MRQEKGTFILVGVFFVINFMSLSSSLIDALCKDMTFKRRKKKSKTETFFRWDIIKIHAITHFSADIKRGGSTQEYSAELFENLHQQVSFLL